MKLKARLMFFALAPLAALSVMAQATNHPPAPPVIDVAPPPTPPAITAEPAAKPAAKPAKTTKPKAKHSKSTTAKAKSNKTATAKTSAPKPATKSTNVIVLNPPVTATVKCDVLDVRGQGSFAGEVITHLKKGESVSVVEEITHTHPHTNEPAHWSKIILPTNTPVWVSAAFVDGASKEVKAKRINVRGGPGENFSVLSHLDKGTVVKEIRKQSGWMEIEPPTNAFAYVASEYLEPAAEAPAAPPAPTQLAVVQTPEPQPAPVPAVVSAPPPPPQPTVVNVPAESAPPVPATPPSSGVAAPAPTAASQADQELAALRRATAPEPLVTAPGTAPVLQPEPGKPEIPRVATREGFVHRSYNIQTPADFELHDIKTGDLIEYIHPAPGQKFKIYVGTRVRVTGIEILDKRWPRTPILEVQTVDLMP